MDGQWAMLGGVGAQPSRILGAMGGALAQVEPDTTVAWDVSARPGFGFLYSARIQQEDSEHGQAPQDRGDGVPFGEQATRGE